MTEGPIFFLFISWQVIHVFSENSLLPSNIWESLLNSPRSGTALSVAFFYFLSKLQIHITRNPIKNENKRIFINILTSPK